ncbi:hypothetical protein HYV11_03460 [Candidatus Dependentiae bacterium]|nr:hypothetical protein [Candidatus Dependentiae bacterium]
MKNYKIFFLPLFMLHNSIYTSSLPEHPSFEKNAASLTIHQSPLYNNSAPFPLLPFQSKRAKDVYQKKHFITINNNSRFYVTICSEAENNENISSLSERFGCSRGIHKAFFYNDNVIITLEILGKTDKILERHNITLSDNTTISINPPQSRNNISSLMFQRPSFIIIT